MNDSTASAPGASLLPDSIAAITTLHFVLMAIVAVAAIAMIVAGARRKHGQRKAERQVEERAADAGVTATADREPEPVAPPVAVAPPPPPPPPPPAAPAPVIAAPAAPPEPEPAPAMDEPAPLADEPIGAAAPLDASPASLAADVPAAPPTPPAGDPAERPVTLLKGLGPKLADRLGTLGITNVGQIAALSDDEAARLDAQLGPFTGRMMRDRWIEQARFLAAGDQAGFEAVFGRL